MAGLSEVRGPASDSFWTWREVMYRFLGRMSPDDVEAVTALAYAEMLEGGFTRAGEFHYLHHDIDGAPYADPAEMAARIAAAAQATGIALTLLPAFYAHGGFGGAPPAPGQRRFISDLDGFARLLEASAAALRGLPGAVLGVAPHSLRAAAPEELAVVAALRPDAPVHMHIAEQVLEVADCRGWSGQTPVEWLLAHQAVDARWCLIHATHMTPAEAAALARTGAVAGLCPITEASLGDGIFPGPDWRDAGGRYGVGTDSNVLIGAAAELRQLEYAQRLGGRARNVMADGAGRSTGRALFDAALAGGAQALGVAPAALAAGQPADLLALDGEAPALVGRHGDALLDGWIFAGGALTAVWVGGQQVVADGRHVAREAIQARYRATLRRLLAA
jgi:formiminoglutamate deiminase